MPEPRDDSEQLLESVGNLETARMTLRWALERIRGLEKSATETNELLRQANSERQGAVDELAGMKRSLESRSKELGEKERFVEEMRGMLNGLFKGEVDVADLIRRRGEIDTAKADIEARVRKRLRDLNELHSSALAEAKKGFQQTLEDERRRAAEEMNIERSAWDEERKRLASRNQEELEARRASWEAERARLELLLKEREGRLAAKDQDLSALERRFFEQLRRREETFETERSKLLERQQELLEESAEQLSNSMAQEALRPQAADLGQNERLRLRIAELDSHHDATVAALQERLESVRRKALEREAKAGELADFDLEALRKHYDAQIEQLQADFVKKSRIDAEEILSLRKQFKEDSESRLQEEARRALEHGQRLRALEAALSEAHAAALFDAEKRHGESLSLHARLSAQKARDEFSEELKHRREDLDRMREIVHRQANAAAAREEDHTQETAALKAKFSEELKNAEEIRRRESESLRAEIESLRSRNSELLETESRKREEHLRSLEGFFEDSRQKSLEDSRRRFEELRHRLLKAEEAPPRNAPLKQQPPSAHELVDGPRSGALRRTLKLIILAAAAALALFILGRSSGLLGRNHELPGSETVALSWSNGFLWAADSKEGSVFKLSLEGERLVETARYALLGTEISGMTAAENRLFVSDAAKGRIERWSVGKGRPVLEKFWPSPGKAPASLYFDGINLWSSDRDSSLIYKHLPDDSLTVLESFPIAHAGAGIVAENGRVWSADSDRAVLFFSGNGRHGPGKSFSLHEQNAPEGISAFTLNDGRAWIALRGTPSLLERPLWRLKPLAENLSFLP